jgi:hypothetical protein
MHKNIAHILNHTGDIVLSWDSSDPENVEGVKNIFATLIAAGYDAYTFEFDNVFDVEHDKEKIDVLDEKINKLIIQKKVVMAPTKVQGGYPVLNANESFFEKTGKLRKNTLKPMQDDVDNYWRSQADEYV